MALAKSYQKMLSKTPKLTPEEERELIIRAKKGDKKAKEKIVLAMQRWVVKVALKYSKVSSAPLEDLIQEGNIGLLKALERFDLKRENRFLTYAAFWVEQYIRRAVLKELLITPPIREIEAVISIMKGLRNEDEFIDATEVLKRINERLNDGSRKLTTEQLELIKTLLRGWEVHLNERIKMKDGEKEELLYFLPADNDVEKEIEERDFRKQIIKEIKETLSEREALIVLMRFGFEDGRTHTFKEIAAKVGISKQRVQYLYKRALGKLRNKLKKLKRDF